MYRNHKRSLPSLEGGTISDSDARTLSRYGAAINYNQYVTNKIRTAEKPEPTNLLREAGDQGHIDFINQS